MHQQRLLAARSQVRQIHFAVFSVGHHGRRELRERRVRRQGEIPRALAQARKLLSDYEEPTLDPAKDEALRAFIAKREAEIPASDALNQHF